MVTYIVTGKSGREVARFITRGPVPLRVAAALGVYLSLGYSYSVMYQDGTVLGPVKENR